MGRCNTQMQREKEKNFLPFLSQESTKNCFYPFISSSWSIRLTTFISKKIFSTDDATVFFPPCFDVIEYDFFLFSLPFYSIRHQTFSLVRLICATIQSFGERQSRVLSKSEDENLLKDRWKSRLSRKHPFVVTALTFLACITLILFLHRSFSPFLLLHFSILSHCVWWHARVSPRDNYQPYSPRFSFKILFDYIYHIEAIHGGK